MTAPFRLTMPEPLEKDIHAACADALDQLLREPAVWWTYPAGAVELSPQQHAAYSRLGLKRGLPDIWILSGFLYCIELKRRGGRLSKSRIVRTRRGSPRFLIGQEDMFPKLIAAGVKEIAICHTVDEVLDQVERWGVPLHHRVGPITIPAAPPPCAGSSRSATRSTSPTWSSASSSRS